MSNQSGTLYVGMTNNIKRRVWEHKNHKIKGFTDKYNVSHLVYVETVSESFSAIQREKQIKKWRREKKLSLIDSLNPTRKDLSLGWFD